MNKFIMCICLIASMVFAEHQNYNYMTFQENKRIAIARDIIMETQRNVSESVASEIAFHLYDAALNIDIEYEYALAVMMVESRFKISAKSPCGAKGLMQIMPSTFLSVAKKHSLDYSTNDMYDIHKNITVGVLYLKMLQDKYGSYDLMSAGYNGGPVVANNWKNARYHAVPNETKKYVNKVRKYHEYYTLRLNRDEI